MQVFEPGDVPVPGYKLTAFLGKGSYGAVYRATGPGGVECALKFINLDNKGGLKEFKAISRVKKFRHPNLVPIFAVWLRDAHGNTMGDGDAGESLTLSMGADKQLVLAMGLGEKSLLDLLAEARARRAADALAGGLGLRRLLKYMQDAAAGIDYLNVLDPEKGGNGAVEIVHCDIKPGNLLLVGGGVQVCDYGVAKALDRSPGQDARTTMAAGTAAYAAPELINNEPGQWTDQYCLAITYYELRTGTLPFPEHRALQAHLLNKLDFGGVPGLEQEVLRQATHMQPDRRFPTCGEFVDALYTQTGITQHGGSGALRLPTDRPSGPPGTDAIAPPGTRVSDLLSPAPPPPPPRKLSDVLMANGELVPDHTLVRQIGQGGYGQVWEARDNKSDEPCALKLVRDLQGKGRHELDILKQMRRLDHPHLLKITDWWVLGPDLQPIKGTGSGGVVAQAVVIRTPLADTNLRKRLDECRLHGQAGIPEAELVRYLAQAADAIDHLNRGDLVHRDIKPENLLLQAGQVLVSDFGLAKLVDRDDGTAAQSTSSGMTQDYAAPEILTQKRVTTQSDQYSLAVTYHVLRTGRLPFPAGLSMLDLIRARASSRLDLTALKPEEQAALRPALSANPADRYPTCLALAEAVARAVDPVPVLIAVPTPPPPPTAPPPADEAADEWADLPADPGATIGPGEVYRVPSSKTDKPAIRDTPREDRPPGPRRPVTQKTEYVRPPKKRGKGKKVAAVLGVLTTMAVLAGVAAYIIISGGKSSGVAQTNPTQKAGDEGGSSGELQTEPTKPKKGGESKPPIETLPTNKSPEGNGGKSPPSGSDGPPPVDRDPSQPSVSDRVAQVERLIATNPTGAKADLLKLPEADRPAGLLATINAAQIRNARAATADADPAARVAKLDKLIAEPDADVKAWAEKVRAAWVAAAPLLRPAADEGKSGATLVADYEAAKKETDARLAGLPEDGKELGAVIRPKLAERVRAVIPKLDGDTDWAGLAKVCDAAEQTDDVKACRLECWVGAGGKGNPPAEIAGADGYTAYVTARSEPRDGPRRGAALTRLAGLIPPDGSRLAWFNGYRAGMTHDLLVEAATAEPVKRPANEPGADPYPAATAATAVTWLTAALRAADRAGERVSDDRRAETRYELVLAGRSAPRPPTADLLAASDALAKPGELDRLRKSAPDQARFWLTRANLQPAATVGSYAKVFDLARRAKPPLPAADLYDAAVRHLLDPKWVADHTPTVEAKAALANVCYLAGREVRRRGGGWDELSATRGRVEQTAAKLFDTAARLDPKPEYATWRDICAVLSHNGPAAPAASVPSAGDPTGRLLAGLAAKSSAEGKLDRAEQVSGLQAAQQSFRTAITGLAGDASRREELALAYKHAADTAILLANFDPRDRSERQKALADAVGWADTLLELDPDWPAAWDTKGCALEDQAWLFKDADPGRFAANGGYALADKAFTAALNRRRTSPEALMHRGRNQVKWAEDLFQHGRAQQVPLDRDKLADARRDLESALKLLADGARPAVQAECHYWLAKAATLDRPTARVADRAGHFKEAVKHFRAAAEAAARPGGDRTGYLYISLFEWARLCNDVGVESNNSGDKARAREMAAAIDDLLTRPEVSPALSPAVAGYHRANALTLRYYADAVPADPAPAFYKWLTDLDRAVTDAVKPPCPAQDDWAKMDLLIRRANAGRVDPKWDIEKAVGDARQAVRISDRNRWLDRGWAMQARMALGRALDTAAGRAADKGEKQRLWAAAGNEYQQAIHLTPDPKASWPAYLQLGLVRALAADQIDRDKVADRASGYVPAVAALMAADADARAPGAATGESADAADLANFRRDRKKFFTGADGKSEIRSFLTAAIEANPNGPTADEWRLALSGVDLLLGDSGQLTAQDRATATQLAKRIQSNPPSSDLALLAKQILHALTR